jgi:hypothetical protein
MDKKNLYLDDIRTPVDDTWMVVRSYDEFVKTITLYGLDSFEMISLDHDLGEGAMKEYFTNVRYNYNLDYNNINEKTGYDCAKWLVSESINKEIPLPLVYVHSANPIGSANMMGYINNYLKNERRPQTCVRVRINHTMKTKID